MRKIKLWTSAVGPKFSAVPGDVIELPDDEAARFVLNGHGEYASDEEVHTETDPMIGVRKAVKKRN